MHGPELWQVRLAEESLLFASSSLREIFQIYEISIFFTELEASLCGDLSCFVGDSSWFVAPESRQKELSNCVYCFMLF